MVDDVKTAELLEECTEERVGAVTWGRAHIEVAHQDYTVAKWDSIEVADQLVDCCSVGLVEVDVNNKARKPCL